jgi:hypothetical protein
MFPHPDTYYVVRESERRLLLDQFAREHAVRAAVAERTGRSDLSHRHGTLPFLGIAACRLGWRPPARLVGPAEAGRS